MKEYNQLVKDIKNKQFLPIYFLEGDESFFIDKITDLIEDNALTEEEKGFNQTITYGLETNIDEIISLAKQFPMIGNKQLIIVKEAQHMKSWDGLDGYINHIQPSTILVFNYKGKKLDGRQKVGKLLAQKKYKFESKKLYDNEIPRWIKDYCQSFQIEIDEKSVFLLANYIGTNLSRIENELNKLKIIIGETKKITPEIIEVNIGISKDYNNFELINALADKNIKKCFDIIDYFDKNPKENPTVVTIAMLHKFLENNILFHTLTSHSSDIIQRELGMSPFQSKDYLKSIKHYNLKKITAAIRELKKADLKSKGVGAVNLSAGEILREFVYFMMYL